MQKTRYELDPYNRFVSYLPKFRKVIDGRFKLDKNNSLSYHVKAPFPEDETIPHQLRIKGSWSLDDEHNLRLAIDKSGRETFGDALTIQGEIIEAKEHSLLFAVTTKGKDGRSSTYVLDLEGFWKADENNRLTFRVKREGGSCDILTFNTAWEIGKGHQLEYRYEKASLVRKKKLVHSLVFKGFWDIRDKCRVSYLIGSGTDSSFDFHASAGVFSEDLIMYEIGIGLTNRQSPFKRKLVLSGSWRPSKGSRLLFEVESEKKKLSVIVFGCEAKLTGRDTVTCRLKKDIDNKDTGITLEFSRDLFDSEGEMFLRASKSKDESAVFAGAAFRW